MRAKLDKLDKIKKDQNAEKMDTATLEASHFHLGSPDDDETPLSELIDQTEFAISSLAKLVEIFINKSHSGEKGYYWVRKEHKVIQSFSLSLYVLMQMICYRLGDFTTCKLPISPW
jgi:hypothetical protein